MNPFVTLPATCELCGNWLPGHSSSCPRNGVHPSQWSFDIIDKNKNNLESNSNHSLHNYIVSSDENNIIQHSKHVFYLLEEERSSTGSNSY